MFAISQDFAPPFKLIAPYFKIAVFGYFIAAMMLLSFDVNISYIDASVISWVHVFLLTFVMMVIFGAMAQLIPVVLEVGHFAVELFYVIWPLLLIGSSMMALGFYALPALLPYGGLIVLIAMLIFVFDVFFTLKKVEKYSIAMKAILVSNSFLFVGLLFGIVMALGYAGVVSVDISALLSAHVYAVVGGYVLVTIMGLSLILLPMFGLSHGFDDKPIHRAIFILSSGVISVMLGALFSYALMQYVGYGLSGVAVMLYFYQIYIIERTRARKENDIWARSMYVAFFSMLLALVFFGLYFVTNKEVHLITGMWVLFYGFFTFVIVGHLYKIVPFLVWFERYAPLVGKKKVPMLHEMVPKQSADAQFGFTLTGATLIALSFEIGSNDLFHGGASFLLIGSVFVMKDMFYMMDYDIGLES